MAFVRYKGVYAYLVENERVTEGGVSRVRQRVLYYFGRDVNVDDAVKHTVAQRFPDATVDWEAVKRTAAGGKTDRSRRRRGNVARATAALNDEWLDWR